MTIDFGSLLYSSDTNPFSKAAGVIGQANVTSPFSSPGTNAAYGIGQGLVAALLGGYGQYQTNQKNAELTPLVQALMSEPTSAGALKVVQANPEHAEKLNPLALALAGSKADAAAKQKAAMEKALLDIQLIPLKEQAKLGAYEERLKLKQQYGDTRAAGASNSTYYAPGSVEDTSSKGFGDFSAADKSDTLKGMDLIKRLDNAATRLLQNPAEDAFAYGQFQLSRILPSLDDKGLAAEVQDAIDVLGKRRSGAALNKDEEQRYQKLAGFDFLATPQSVARYLRRLGRREVEGIETRIRYNANPENLLKDLNSFKERFDAPIPPGTGFELKTKSDGTQVWYNPLTKEMVPLDG